MIVSFKRKFHLGKIVNFYSWYKKMKMENVLNVWKLSLFLSLRWTDSVMWYLFRWRVVYGSGRLSVWNLPPNEERKQVCASASERYLKFFHSKWRIDDSHYFFHSLFLSNCWSTYNPHSNVLWLHYLADKLLSMSYKNKAQSNQQRTLKSGLKSFQSEILNYPSATEALMNCKFFQWNVCFN